ncbi:MAG: RtcB family protein [Lachnospiraceae bacterium]|nr:RtcB family protein [Lachnospiraceae bacterium]
MIKINGKRNTALVYSDRADKETVRQLEQMLCLPALADSRVRVMPDVHKGRGCVIGFTMTLPARRVVPSFVGVDIGCGITAAKLDANEIDFAALDRLVRETAGKRTRETVSHFFDRVGIGSLLCRKEIDAERAALSLGTLGGGNHFVEVDRDETGALWLLVHSGSRSLGNDVSRYYQTRAYRENRVGAHREQKRQYREDSEEYGIRIKAVTREKQAGIPVGYEYACAEGNTFDDYLHDLAITQNYAALNRLAITEELVRGLGVRVTDRVDTVHNYIDPESKILRKGAVSARQGERLVIPFNMRDGAVLCVGLGNPEWNFSAPHGAGRACSRSDAKHAYTVEQFEREMEGVWSSTVGKDTIDECPMAYKSPDRVLPWLSETAEVVLSMRPVYNFKAGDSE